MDGYSGRGRQNKQMNGPIQLAYNLGGYQIILPNANTHISVTSVEQLGTIPQFFPSSVTRLLEKRLYIYLVETENKNTKLSYFTP